MSAEYDYQVFYPQIKAIIEVGIWNLSLQKAFIDNTQKRLARAEAASDLPQTETSSDEHEHEYEPVGDENLE